jgi:thymidylate synthase
MDFKPRNGELFMTAFFRSQAVSKSGYADYTALVEMGNFICEQTDLILSRVTNIAGSGHIRNQNDEKKNTIKLLEAVGCAV